jgi:hypothetical protein
MKLPTQLTQAMLAMTTIVTGLAQVPQTAKPDLTGTGQAEHIPIWTNSKTLGNSVIYSSGGEVGIGTTTPAATLEVNGNTQVDGNLSLSGSILENGAGTLIWAPNNGSGNLAVGLNNLSSTTNGSNNTGVGVGALAGDNFGGYNTAVGASALSFVGSGVGNTAVGYDALSANSSNQNTAVGSEALVGNGGGEANTAVGASALMSNSSGANNVSVGAFANTSNTTGNNNTAVGYLAGMDETAGYQGTGSNNTFIGYKATPTGASDISNAAAIGANAQVGQSNTLILGGTGSNAVTVGIGTATPFNDYALVIQTPSSGQINGGVVSNASGGNIFLGMTNGTHKFRVDTNGEVYADGGVQSSGADFAESVAVRGLRSQYEPGDVLEIDPKADRSLRLSQHPYATMVAGIYSTKPGLLATPHPLHDPTTQTSEVPMAIVGIVPCKVTAENGPIARGDLLVTSSRPGYAMKGTDRRRMLGAVVGKALEALPKGSGVIQVLVTLQ